MSGSKKIGKAAREKLSETTWALRGDPSLFPPFYARSLPSFSRSSALTKSYAHTRLTQRRVFFPNATDEEVSETVVSVHTHLSSKHYVPTITRKSVLFTNLVWTKAAQNDHFLKLAKFLVPVSWQRLVLRFLQKRTKATFVVKEYRLYNFKEIYFAS